MITQQKEPEPRLATLTELPDGDHRRVRKSLRVIVPLVIVVVAAAIAWSLIETAPKAPQRRRTPSARLVEVAPIRFGQKQTVIRTSGVVQPAQEVELRALVSGEVVRVSPEFIPGGRFRRGETILQIDPTDYDLAIRQRASEVTRARGVLSVEMGQQAIAKREYEILGTDVTAEDRELVLRRPQLATAQAAVAAAEAALAQAELARRRTTVNAPFNGTVQARQVNLGAQLSASTPLATLVGTDEYWVEVAVPVSDLRWLVVPHAASQTGSPARIYNEAEWGRDVSRLGSLVRVASDLEEKGRMARVLIGVRDPLAIGRESAGRPTMLVGSYVRVEIDGVTLDSVAVIPRNHIRDGDNVWIMTPDNTLEIRPVTVAFRGADFICISRGVQEGELLVTTDLSAPVAGMALRTRATEDSTRGSGEGRRGAGRRAGR